LRNGYAMVGDRFLRATRQHREPLRDGQRANRRLGVDVCVDAQARARLGGAFAPERVGKNSSLHGTHFQACHGPRIACPERAKELRRFPREDRVRLVDTVIYGVRNMPPWGRDMLKPDGIDTLWAYVAAGEGKNNPRFGIART
jgi:cytochrome c5